VWKTALGSGGIGLVLGFFLGFLAAGKSSWLTSLSVSRIVEGELEPPAPTPLLRVSDILSDGESLHGSMVRVEGRALGVAFKVSGAGNPYALLSVEDRTGRLKVYARGHPSVSEGDSVRVTGVYSHVKKVGKYTFENELEAREIEPIR
jgi:hypothetical protein